MDDDDGLSIPEFLRRKPTPGAKPPSMEEAPVVATLKPEDALRYARKRKRRLRAEVRALSDELEKFKIARVGKDMIEAAERKWLHAYTELASMED
jgi:hypothetical protein